MQIYEFSPVGLQNAFEDANFKNQVKKHLKNNGKAYITITLLASGFVIGMNEYVEAASGIDAEARKIYGKIIEVGKWVIIFKGGMEVIQRSMEGDFGTAKSKFLQYLITYGVLWALPWGMDQIEAMFKNL